MNGSSIKLFVAVHIERTVVIEREFGCQRCCRVVYTLLKLQILFTACQEMTFEIKSVREMICWFYVK